MPWFSKSINEYLYPDVTSKKVNEVLGKYDYLACGHTHYQAIIKNKNRLLFNPGSVGQPRERGKKVLVGVVLILKLRK